MVFPLKRRSLAPNMVSLQPRPSLKSSLRISSTNYKDIDPQNFYTHEKKMDHPSVPKMVSLQPSLTSKPFTPHLAYSSSQVTNISPSVQKPSATNRDIDPHNLFSHNNRLVLPSGSTSFVHPSKRQQKEFHINRQVPLLRHTMIRTLIQLCTEFTLIDFPQKQNKLSNDSISAPQTFLSDVERILLSSFTLVRRCHPSQCESEVPRINAGVACLTALQDGPSVTCDFSPPHPSFHLFRSNDVVTAGLSSSSSSTKTSLSENISIALQITRNIALMPGSRCFGVLRHFPAYPIPTPTMYMTLLEYISGLGLIQSDELDNRYCKRTTGVVVVTPGECSFFTCQSNEAKPLSNPKMFVFNKYGVSDNTPSEIASSEISIHDEYSSHPYSLFLRDFWCNHLSRDISFIKASTWWYRIDEMSWEFLKAALMVFNDTGATYVREVEGRQLIDEGLQNEDECQDAGEYKNQGFNCVSTEAVPVVPSINDSRPVSLLPIYNNLSEDWGAAKRRNEERLQESNVPKWTNRFPNLIRPQSPSPGSCTEDGDMIPTMTSSHSLNTHYSLNYNSVTSYRNPEVQEKSGVIPIIHPKWVRLPRRKLLENPNFNTNPRKLCQEMQYGCFEVFKF
eukprot:Tbor_TRINITY_DN5927_c1_g3::TRINITY_DN5927_c1_g3_i1::g.18243::m.18243